MKKDPSTVHLLSVVALDENRCGLDRLDSLAVRGLSDRLLSRLPSARRRNKVPLRKTCYILILHRH